MAFTNSPLVDYKRLSPNHSGKRNHAIDTVSIHCVVGQCSAETLGNIFASTSTQASSNYGVDKDGRIGLYVEEKNRSWCTSSSSNDNRAITIEVASDTYHPYKVTSKAYKGLIKLLVDICKRNGIKKLVWSTKASDRLNHRNGCNMTVHRDYANKSCPGDYLYKLHGQIAKDVNAQLGATTTKSTTTTSTKSTTSKTDDIKVDGVWGVETTKKAQKVFGTPVDGKVSNQDKQYASKNKGLLSSTFEWESNPKGGSQLIKAIQKKVGTTQDGVVGTKTITAMQKWLGTTQDGFVSNPSNMVKAFQKWLNKQ